MTTPIPSNGYPIPPNNPTGQAFWQHTLDNLHGRLVDIKAEIAVTIESLGDDAAALALDLVANSVAPQLASLKPVKFTSVSANANLDIGGAYRLRAASITLTLPATPANGDSIRIVDGEVLSSENTVTIARNGQTIMGLAENLTLDVAGIDVTLWYTGTTWRLF